MLRRRTVTLVAFTLGTLVGAAGAAVSVAGAAPTAAPAARAAQAPPTIAGCPSFPAGNAWNTRVDARPVAPASAKLIASIGLDRGLHADFGSGL